MKLKRGLSAFAFTGLLFFCHNGFGDALDNWHWRNPLPNGNPQALPHTLYGIVFANGCFVAVGDSGTVSISADATNWTESATAVTNKLNAITYANGLFLAVGEGGAVETSSNGTNWAAWTSGTIAPLKAAAYGNGKYVAVGTGGAIICSSNAVNWSPGIPGTNIDFSGIAFGSNSFVAVGPSSDLVFSSSDGTAWTYKSVTTGPNGTGGFPFNFPLMMQHAIVTYANGVFRIGSHRYVSSLSADVFIFNSTDGNFWTTNALGNFNTGTFGFDYNFFLPGNGNLIAAGTENSVPFLQVSTDGVNWTFANNLPSNYRQGTAGAYGNGTYVILAAPFPVFGVTLPPIFTSTDGLNWTNQQHPLPPPAGSTDILTSIAFSIGVYAVTGSNSIVRSTNGLAYTAISNSPSLVSVTGFGGSFVGVGSGGKIYQSSDGLSWTQRNSGTLDNLRGVTSGGGLLMAVGDNGAIQTSSSGTIWTSRTSGTSLTLYGAAYGSGLFVAVGYWGTVLTSPDGISWTGQDSGQLTNLLSVTYGPAGFAAVGPGGTILTSTDGINWTKQNSGTLASLNSITFGNGCYLTAGDGVVVLTSPDGIRWTPRNIGATGGQNLYGSAFLNNRFDVVGSGGTILESDAIAPLFDLEIHPGGNWLTTFAPPGSNFRIQTSTNLNAPGWTDTVSFSNAPAIMQWTNTAPELPRLFYRAVSP